MSYKEIAERVLRSQEIRISPDASFFRERFLSPAVGFVFSDGCAELRLEDKGTDLDLNITPVISSIHREKIGNWPIVLSGLVYLVEVKERWFFEQPSERLLSRFLGIKTVGHDIQVDIEVDDDVVGAFRIHKNVVQN